MFRDKLPSRRVFPSCVLTQERSVPQPDGTVKVVRVSSNTGIPDPFTTDLKSVLDAGIPLQQVSKRLPLSSVDFDREVPTTQTTQTTQITQTTQTTQTTQKKDGE